MGALLVRRYAVRYPEGIVGMVLAGPTHENTRLFFPTDNQWPKLVAAAIEEVATAAAKGVGLLSSSLRGHDRIGQRPHAVIRARHPIAGLQQYRRVAR
jgi:pimeloyl-ACP methyl ester carboxylesterase